MAGLFDFLKSTPSQVPSRHPRANPQSLYNYVSKIVLTPEPRVYTNTAQLQKVARSLFEVFKDQGLHVEEQKFKAGGRIYSNIIASYGLANAPRIVIGAHYDVAGYQQGADDNASGVAGLLELGRLLSEIRPHLDHRVDLVAYCLEEPPFFGGDEMGSAVHAKSLAHQSVQVKFMLSLEMIGYFTDRKDSQAYPLDSLKYIYPNQGNFIAVVGTLDSVALVKKVKTLMQKNSNIPVESINAPGSLPGVGLSDHSSYWRHGYKALMITDTAFFRNPNYHTAQDTIETLNFDKMAEVINGIYGVVTLS